MWICLIDIVFVGYIFPQESLATPIKIFLEFLNWKSTKNLSSVVKFYTWSVGISLKRISWSIKPVVCWNYF